MVNYIDNVEIEIMNNIQFIVGNSIDGRNITIDGAAIESYIQYQNEQDVDCVELNFASGKTICVSG